MDLDSSLVERTQNEAKAMAKTGMEKAPGIMVGQIMVGIKDLGFPREKHTWLMV